MDLKVSPIAFSLTPPPLHFWEHVMWVSCTAHYFGQCPNPCIRHCVLATWACGATLLHLQEDSHTYTSMHNTHNTLVLSFTLVFVKPPASNAHSLSFSQQAEPVHSQSNTHRMTSRGQGPYPFTLVCQLHWQNGRKASPTFSCPSTMLTGAGKQGTPPLPHSCPSAHVMDTRGRGIPRASQQRGQRISALGGLGLDVGLHPPLTWWVGAGMGSLHLSGSYCSPTWALGLSLAPVWVNLDGDFDRKMNAWGCHGKESRELRGRMLCR